MIQSLLNHIVHESTDFVVGTLDFSRYRSIPYRGYIPPVSNLASKKDGCRVAPLLQLSHADTARLRLSISNVMALTVILHTARAASHKAILPILLTRAVLPSPQPPLCSFTAPRVW